ncbi:MAG: hypothetical protein M3305_04945, partial [Actinomycetota bacterium]|nr:hypothetical protein [Actinomycetota bacterium]
VVTLLVTIRRRPLATMGLKAPTKERRPAMQVDSAVRGVRTIPRRRRLNVVLAIVAVVVIGAMVALLVWTAPLARSGVGTRDADNPEAGAVSAVIHDDAGDMFPEAGSAVVHDDAGNMDR